MTNVEPLTMNPDDRGSGLPVDPCIGLGDAVQWLACGQARSRQPKWLYEEELGLSPLIERCQLEMKADEGRYYPFKPIDIGGNPKEIFRTLKGVHRAYWPPSGQELLVAAIAAARARIRKNWIERRTCNRVMQEW